MKNSVSIPISWIMFVVCIYVAIYVLIPIQTRNNLSDFSGTDKLIQYVKEDTINELNYTDDFVCHEFTLMFIEKAKNNEKYVYYVSLTAQEAFEYFEYVSTLTYVNNGITISFPEPTEKDYKHSVVGVDIGTIKFIIEPQNDMVFEVTEVGYEIIYFGEITR